ncbi:DUF3040 domain-containing protein [Actinomadura welshii]
MEEQRILTQIEVRLSEDDPRLAHRLARLGAPRRRGRTVVLAAAAVITVLAAIGAAVAAAALWPPPPPPPPKAHARVPDPALDAGDRPPGGRGDDERQGPGEKTSPGPRRSRRCGGRLTAKGTTKLQPGPHGTGGIPRRRQVEPGGHMPHRPVHCNGSPAVPPPPHPRCPDHLTPR